MQRMPRSGFPEGSLLSAMLGEHAPVDVRRAARRLRTENAPAVAIGDDIAGLARGLSLSEVSRSPAVLDVLPPLFWLEAGRSDGTGTGPREVAGWIVEKKGGGLAARRFGIVLGPEAVPESEGTATVSFGPGTDDEETGFLRGLVTVVGLPEMMAQMGESSPILLMPADASERDAGVLRGLRLSVALSPDAAPA